jgi:ethanolamine utilization protein EutQ (cupin superfamily)
MKLSTLMTTVVSVAAFGVSATLYAHGVAVPQGSKQLQFFDEAASQPIASMNEPGVNAYFEDIVGSSDPRAPISCGMFKIEKGNPLVYTYDYDDTKIVTDGHIYFSDGEQKVRADEGDVLFFPKGSTITFSSDDYGTAYACGQRKLF